MALLVIRKPAIKSTGATNTRHFPFILNGSAQLWWHKSQKTSLFWSYLDLEICSIVWRGSAWLHFESCRSCLSVRGHHNHNDDNNNTANNTTKRYKMSPAVFPNTARCRFTAGDEVFRLDEKVFHECCWKVTSSSSTTTTTTTAALSLPCDVHRVQIVFVQHSFITFLRFRSWRVSTATHKDTFFFLP